MEFAVESSKYPGVRLSFSVLIFTVCNVLGVIVAPVGVVAQTPVLTWHYDNQRSGANTTETVLTTSNVNYKTFGKDLDKADRWKRRGTTALRSEPQHRGTRRAQCGFRGDHARQRLCV